MPNNYEVNYDDERFDHVETEKEEALTDLEETYGGMIDESDSYYDAQIKASQDWADKQSQLQQEQTDFAIEQVEQQKDKAHKDYVKEQSGAYADWQKQSNRYGAEAERQASAGLTGTGFGESSQVSMYNTYQNRFATARESYNQIVLDFNNQITQAKLQNNSILAEIAAEAQKQRLELALQGFQYKNQLILEKANKKTELESIYYQKYLDVLNQINHENALAEEIRQYNQDYEFKKQQAEEDKRRWEEEMKFQREQYEWQKAKASSSGSSGSSGKSSSSSKSSVSTKNYTVQKGSTGKNNYVQINNDGKTPTSGSTTPTNNMQSIINLGYGPISESKLAELMASGQVTRTLKDGQYYYSKNTSSPSYNWLKDMGPSY